MRLKNVLLLIILSLILTNLYGQAFNGGIRAGLTASEVSGDNLAGPTKLGWFASAFTSLQISEHTDLMLEIMYIQKGSRSVPSERNNFYDYKFYLQYVEIPVLFQTDISRYTHNSVMDKISVNFGLSVSVLVDNLELLDGSTSFSPNERNNFHAAELNLLLGFSIPLSSAIDFRMGYSNGLTPIRPHSSGGKTWYNRGQYNSVWSFGVAYTIW
jgi:hypothetical protein